MSFTGGVLVKNGGGPAGDGKIVPTPVGDSVQDVEIASERLVRRLSGEELIFWFRNFLQALTSCSLH